MNINKDKPSKMIFFSEVLQQRLWNSFTLHKYHNKKIQILLHVNVNPILTSFLFIEQRNKHNNWITVCWKVLVDYGFHNILYLWRQNSFLGYINIYETFRNIWYWFWQNILNFLIDAPFVSHICKNKSAISNVIYFF